MSSGKTSSARTTWSAASRSSGSRASEPTFRAATCCSARPRRGLRRLTRAVEERLSERLSNPVQAVVFTRARYRAAVAAAPDSWGRDDTREHNALFTLRGVTSERVVEQLPTPKPDIETPATRPGVIF